MLRYKWHILRAPCCTLLDRVILGVAIEVRTPSLELGNASAQQKPVPWLHLQVPGWTTSDVRHVVSLISILYVPFDDLKV